MAVLYVFWITIFDSSTMIQGDKKNASVLVAVSLELTPAKHVRNTFTVTITALVEPLEEKGD